MLNIYNYLSSLSLTLRQNPNYADDIANSFSPTQLTSKKWLVEELLKRCNIQQPKILILGGWYGSFLVPMLTESLKPSEIILTDIDTNTVRIASSLHVDTESVKYETLDACNPRKRYMCDIVINTSCEHMPTIGEEAVSNPGCLYVLQTCDNAKDPGHINTSNTTEEFVEKTGLSNIIFKGRHNIGHKNRFMVIGYM